jgi:regulator of protease activity HflC (stomatin/prohibitin superfamily)
MLTFVTAFLLVAGLIVWKTFIVVPMREANIVERLGRFRAVLNPGYHFLIPVFDRVAYRHDIREQVLDIPGQSCITRDNIQVHVDGIVYLKVTDPERASYGIENYHRAAVNLAQTTMRAEVGKLSLGQTFSEREKVNEAIVEEIDKASDPWGIKILRYELKNITPSPDVMLTLEKLMEAERQKRAEITNADAKKEATINLSEGDRQAEINLSEGEKQRRINEAKGRATSISLIAEATAKGTEMIAKAIEKPGGNAAINAQLVGRYIETLGEIAERAEVSVIPLELANVQGFFQGLSTITGGEELVGDSRSGGTSDGTSGGGIGGGGPDAMPGPGGRGATGPWAPGRE